MTDSVSNVCILRKRTADTPRIALFWRLKIGQNVQDAGGVPGVYYDQVSLNKFFPYWQGQEAFQACLSLTDQGVADYADRRPDGFLMWEYFRQRERSIQFTHSPMLPPAKTPTNQAKVGYVYLLRSQDGLHKIGKALDPEVRIRSLGVLLPFDITPIHTIPSSDYTAAEKYLHNKFAAQRKRGEWFDLSEADLAFIMGLKEL